MHLEILELVLVCRRSVQRCLENRIRWPAREYYEYILAPRRGARDKGSLRVPHANTSRLWVECARFRGSHGHANESKMITNVERWMRERGVSGQIATRGRKRQGKKNWKHLFKIWLPSSW